MLLNRIWGISLPPLAARDAWYFVGTFSWYVPLLNYWISGTAYFTSWHVFVVGTLLTVSLTTLCFFCQVASVLKITSLFPEARQTLRRVSLMLVLAILITLAFEVGLLYICSRIPALNYQLTWDTSKYLMALGLIMNLLSISVYEGFYSFSQWNRNLLEKEQLKKANLQSQYDSLKNQVNPHFLFNSLNTLSSLIEEDAAQAGAFVDELSKVYRYLLQSNEKDLTTLADEVRFIGSYTHLLQTRHGQGIEMAVEVEEQHKGSLLPPLTLQMLVENAVKHNVVLAGRPLRIHIRTTDGGWLQVRNNLQRKTSCVSSNRIGLNNIITKYRLLTQQDVVVSETDTCFSVMLPLIHPYPHAGTHR